MEVGLRQGIMRIGKVLVNFQSVGKLNGSFPVLALGAIPLAAFEIFMFAHIGVAEAPGQ